jgi:helicase
MLRGLFIGIDKYQPPVSRLSCAVADAQALGGLFADSLDGEFKSLLDETATQEAIRRELKDLEACATDDFVVITFSGHGTEDHRLVPADADVQDLSASCISLDELAQRLDHIPAKRLLVVLDCCFSGGFGGARVFAPAVERSMVEDRSAIEALARGTGRIVITASGAGEPALETVEFGHGLLSYYLVNGLQGPEGLASAGRIPLLDLFQFTMQGVVAAAIRMQRVQTPTLYGSLEGAPTLAVLTPGSNYAAAFPHRVRQPATTEWQSLESYGFSKELLNAWAAAMPGLNDLQIKAINEYGVLDGKSLLVVAPTGAGKTMVGELAALRAVAEGSRAVLLLPLKALVNDKYEYMTRVYGKEAQVVRATGDHSDQVGAILTGQYDLALLTYEKFMNLALGNPHIMSALSVVVIDEVQTLSDVTRGPSLEFLLTLLRSGHGRQTSPQLVALSAVIGDTHGLERWLDGALLRSTERPVPLRESVIDASGSARTREPDGSETHQPNFVQPQFVSGSQSNKPWVIPLVQRLVREGKKVIATSHRASTCHPQMMRLRCCRQAIVQPRRRIFVASLERGSAFTTLILIEMNGWRWKLASVIPSRRSVCSSQPRRSLWALIRLLKLSLLLVYGTPARHRCPTALLNTRIWPGVRAVLATLKPARRTSLLPPIRVRVWRGIATYWGNQKPSRRTFCQAARIRKRLLFVASLRSDQVSPRVI